MTALTLATGKVLGVEFHENARVFIDGFASRLVPSEQGDVARAAMRDGREVSIFCEGEVNTRTVRLVPVVVVKARGRVIMIVDDGYTATTRAVVGTDRQRHTAYGADAIRAAARALADAAEVEIVSIDGGADIVRVCK